MFEISGFLFWRNALAGLVVKFSANPIDIHYAAFDAKNLILIKHCTVNAVGTGAGHFLTKQHSETSHNQYLTVIIHNLPSYFHYYFLCVIRSGK